MRHPGLMAISHSTPSAMAFRVVAAIHSAGLVTVRAISGDSLPVLKQGERVHHQRVADMREPLPSGSRWSVWFCEAYQQRVLALNRRIGLSMIPIGRHSLMNGVGLSDKAATQRAEAEVFTAGLQTFFGRVNDFCEWTRVKLHTNLLRVDLPWEAVAQKPDCSWS